MTKRLLASSTLTCALLAAAVSYAEPGSRRSPPAGNSAQTEQQNGHATPRCDARRATLDREKRQLEGYRSDLAELETQEQELERRLHELHTRRTDLARMVSIQENRVRHVEATGDRECLRQEACARHEALASELREQSSTERARMQETRVAIESTRHDLATLEPRIEPLRKEYAESRCNEPVPGETAQKAIDHCSTVVSEWLAVQSQLDEYDSRLPQLEIGHRELLARVRSIQTRAQVCDTYLAKNCATILPVSARLDRAELRRSAEALGKVLDDLVADLARLRDIKIVPAPR